MNKQLSRICTSCGIEKPLTAFLYLTSKLGTAYGSICATCRGKGVTEEKPKPVSEDEKSPATAGQRIGVKQLAEIELQKKHEREGREEKQDVELKQREKLKLDKTESGELKEKTEKSLRETLQGFINYQSKKNPFSAQSVLNEKKNQSSIGAPFLDEKQRAIEANRKLEAVKEEQYKNSVDLSGAPVLDESSFTFAREATVQRMESFLSGDTPIMKNKSQFYRVEVKKPDASAEQKKQSESPREFIERNWGPSSRRR